MLLRIANELPGVDILVTQNGAAVPEIADADGIHDPGRIEYFRDHFAAVLAARDQGAPLRGYFGWSLLDNIEWAEGWGVRFGVVSVDAGT